MAICVKTRSSASHAVLSILATVLMSPAIAQDEWVLPRTEYGHPDLQGNWSNATMTPIQRPEGLGPVLTPQQVAELEEGRQDFIAELAQESDPNREAPPEGGIFTGNALFDSASGGTGGYNYFYIDAGDNIAIYNGEARSSLVVDPSNGRIPELTEAGMAAIAANRAQDAAGEYDNPENRPMGERCLLSFGNNLGPPLLPNYFYNNNYTIVQTANEVLIMTEMVHDYRVIRLGEPRPMADHMRPWFGDSWGRWEGDTLVVETTNLPLKQVNSSRYVVPGGSEQYRVSSDEENGRTPL
jgi:hypothetical protein